jgi:tetratricopeptide (TPR) repeat protein
MSDGSKTSIVDTLKNSIGNLGKPLTVEGYMKYLVLLFFISIIIWPVSASANNIVYQTDQIQDEPSQSASLSRDQQLYNSGIDKLNSGDSDGALADFEAAVRINPKLSNAFFNIAGIYMEKQDWKKASKHYHNYIFLVWDNSAAYRNLGICYAAQGNNFHATGYLNRAVDMNPQDPDNFYARGAYWGDKKHYRNALADFTSAITLRPNNGKYYFLRAQIYTANGNPVAALLDFDKAKELGYQEDK